MDNADDLDLDSLMELLDDTPETCENEHSSSSLDQSATIKDQHSNTSVGNKLPALQSTLVALKDIPLDFLDPRSSLKDQESSPSVNSKSALQKNLAGLKDIPLDFISQNLDSTTKAKTVIEGSLVHSKDFESSDEDENKQFLTEEGKILKRKIALPSRNSLPPHRLKKSFTWSDTAKKVRNPSDLEKLLTDSYSGIRIVNPVISFDMMQKRMQGRKMIKMSFIKGFIKGSDIEGDWVTIGVIINKLPPKTSKNGKTYSIWKLSDLHDCEKIVSVFLFGAAHSEHWKTSVGSVIGFLNPSIMPDKDANKNGELNLSIDHAGKLMLMGKSKDFGHCKGKKKDGSPCTAVVNQSQCEYCVYHVKKEYKRFSAKRSEIQAGYSGREPSLKDRMLKKQNVFYGGQMFSSSEKIRKSTKQVSSKDKLTLLNLGLKRKAEALETEEKSKGIKKLTELYGSEILATAEKNSEFINNQLAIPTAGSRNLLHHIIKEKSKKEGENVKVITPKELLKMRDSYSKSRSLSQTQSDNLVLKNLVPQIGKGLEPGQTVNLDFLSSRKTKVCTTQDLAKLKAIQKIQNKGPIKRQDPNSVKVSSDSATKVKAVLDNSMDENKDYVKEEEIVIPKSSLGNIDMNSEKVKRFLSRKSSHAYEVEMEEMEKQATYFNALEKKELMEEKMASTYEIVCDVVSCKQCRYTAHHAADMCKEHSHPLKCHKALKRFFECRDCKRRTFCFTKLPKRSCRNCGGSNYERTGMFKPRCGPKLDSETLNIRGDEIKFLNCSI